MKLNVTPENFAEIVKQGYSMDNVYMLMLIDAGYDVDAMCGDSVRLSTIKQTLLRKALISEEGHLTVIGQGLLALAGSITAKKLVKRKPATSEFEEWWAKFPGTDNFEWKGKKFTGSRALRASKPDCQVKFDKILIEGEYTAQQLIAALEYEVYQKKEQSVKLGENKLKYMHNSLTYLNQRDFEPFIELVGKLETSYTLNDSPKIGATDI